MPAQKPLFVQPHQTTAFFIFLYDTCRPNPAGYRLAGPVTVSRTPPYIQRHPDFDTLTTNPTGSYRFIHRGHLSVPVYHFFNIGNSHRIWPSPVRICPAPTLIRGNRHCMESGIPRAGQIACTGEPFHDNAGTRLVCRTPCLKPDTGTSLLYGMTIGLLHKFLHLFQTRRCRTSIKHTENNHAVRKNGKIHRIAKTQIARQTVPPEKCGKTASFAPLYTFEKTSPFTAILMFRHHRKIQILLPET